MNVKSLSPRMPVTVAKNDVLSDAAVHLAEEEIGALVIFDVHGLAGILSERDIVRAVSDGCDLGETEVREYMTESPVVVEEDASVLDAVRLMSEAGIRHLVVAAGADVTGVVSLRDVAPVIVRLSAPITTPETRTVGQGAGAA